MISLDNKSQQEGCLQTADLLVLHRIKGVGNKAQRALIDYYKEKHLNSLDDLLKLDLGQAPMTKKALSLLSDFFEKNLYEITRVECENDLARWQSAGIAVIAFGSSEYPTQLASLDDPPALLFCKGNLSLLSSPKSIAVVGTRENTNLGETITRKTVEYFSSLGFCIVSGLALGIDTIAHDAALENSATTIAVLVDLVKISPPGNRNLAEQILDKNGLLISENPPGTKSVRGFFVKRDRIQAGLGMAVFAIETSIDGGTMHAVKTANSIQRDVYVPDVAAARYPDLDIKAISGTQSLVRGGLSCVIEFFQLLSGQWHFACPDRLKPMTIPSDTFFFFFSEYTFGYFPVEFVRRLLKIFPSQVIQVH
jgi:DNA processing protein